MEYLLFIAIGIVAGLLSGMMGISGGVVIVPSLLFLRPILPYELSIKSIIAISLASVILNSLASMITHIRLHQKLPNFSIRLAIGAVIGAILGPFLAIYIPKKLLLAFFQLILLYVAGYYLFFHKSKEKKRPKSFPSLTMGAIVAMVASMTGIGGGVFIVPLLSILGHSLKVSIATSSVFSFVTVFMGSSSYFVLDFLHKDPNAVSFSYISIMCIALASLLFAPFGAWLTHRISKQYLSKMFGVLILIVDFLLTMNYFAK